MTTLRRGFTLIEVCVTLAILAVMIGLLLAAVQKVRSAASRAACQNNFRQIGLAFHNQITNYGRFPPQSPAPGNTKGSSYLHEGTSWHTFILPEIEQEALWMQIVSTYTLHPDPFSTAHVKLKQTVVPTFVCPADARLKVSLSDQNGLSGAFTSYVGVTGNIDNLQAGLFGRRIGARPADLSDGLSNTLAVGERPPPDDLSVGWWYTTHVFENLPGATDTELPTESGIGPTEIQCGGWALTWPDRGRMNIYAFGPGHLNDPCDRYHYWSLHDQGGNFLMADGSVRFLTYSARFQLHDLATIAGGEVADAP